MKIRRFPLWSAVMIMMLGAGCTSMRFATTLPPSSNREMSLGEVKANVARVSCSFDKDMRRHVAPSSIAPAELMTLGRQLYPRIFSNAPGAIPVHLDITSAYFQNRGMPALGFLIQLCTLFIVPGPMLSDAAHFDVRVRVADEDQGPILDQTVHFRRTDFEWWSEFSPLGLIPVPGRSDVPRCYSIFIFASDGECAVQRGQWLTEASCVEAVVKALQKGEPGKMAAAARLDARRIEAFTVGGQSLWCKRAARSSRAPEDIVPDTIWAEIYTEDPASGALPAETVQIAKQAPGGAWQTMPQYLCKPRTLCRATAVIENGKPLRAEVAEVKEIPIAEFLQIQPAHVVQGMQYAQWRTRVLLQAKTRALPALLREKPSEYLRDLVVNAEQEVLHCAHESELAKNRAQQAVEKGGDPTPDREWSLVYKEHTAVINAILAEIKQELANRAR